MSHTTVTYKGEANKEPQFRLDMRWLSDAITNKSSSIEAKKLTLQIGNETSFIGDHFDIDGDFDQPKFHLENANQKMDFVGFALSKNIELNVSGSVGHYTGSNLKGGKLKIQGNVGDFGGCEMSNGELEIDGDASDYLGGAQTGNKKGMSGGSILVHGNSNHFTGDLMRRGTIMVVGNIGDYCASRMIAGTIANLGTIGKQVGVGMRRGTILLPHKPKDVITGFHDCGRHNLGYLTLLLHEIRSFESTFQSLHPMRRRVQRYLGDTAVGGQGEMLIWIG